MKAALQVHWVSDPKCSGFKSCFNPPKKTQISTYLCVK